MKKYNNEEIVISLTSWKGRIATTYKTIDSLLKWCSYTHIVLVLAEEEFVNKEKDLPKSIMQYVENDKIELLWVNKNYITYKKSFFTAKKYPNSIIVTADDDKIYTEDFISELYAYWLTNKKAIVTYKSSVDLNFHYKNTCYQYGEAVLYPPNYYDDVAVWLLSQNDIFDIINKYPNDDYFHTALRSVLYKNDFIVINRSHSEIATNHDEGEVVTKNRRTLNSDKDSEEYKNIIKNIEDEQYKVEEEITTYINNKLGNKCMTNIEKIKAMQSVFEDIVESKELTALIEKYSKLDKLPKFIFAGVGKNWYICEKVVKTFISMGIHAEALDCTHALHGDLGILSNVNYIDEEKVIFFISKSGTTAELIKLAKVVKALKLNDKIKNTYTISFNLNTERPFANLFDLAISPSKKFANMPMYEFDKRNLVPSLSINTMQMVLDLFGNELYESKPELVENYVYNHLGGSNGEKLGGNKILETV